MDQLKADGDEIAEKYDPDNKKASDMDLPPLAFLLLLLIVVCFGVAIALLFSTKS